MFPNQTISNPVMTWFPTSVPTLCGYDMDSLKFLKEFRCNFAWLTNLILFVYCGVQELTDFVC